MRRATGNDGWEAGDEEHRYPRVEGKRREDMEEGGGGGGGRGSGEDDGAATATLWSGGPSESAKLQADKRR